VVPSTYVKEVMKTHILQVTEVSQPHLTDESKNKALNIFKVFATQKKKQEDKATKLPELVEAPTAQAILTTLPTSTAAKPGPQYC
jgi:hypothetical protein